jgi:two-component system response regulator FixJ
MSTNTGPVMVVDDDDAVRQSLQFALELEGLEVQAYGSGAQLLARETMPEKGCLVVDYYMPTMDGVELLDRLRLRHVDLPAILITAKATGEIRQRALRAGFRQVLEKPLEDSALIDGIRRLLADA